MNDIYNAFHEYFELIEADSDELLDEVFRLRYEIFCLEQGIFDAKNYPNAVEKDEYDPYSIHILLRHRLSGESVGCVRLILDNNALPNNAFPVEHYMQIDHQIIDTHRLPRSNFAEISRFSVLKKFLKRDHEQNKSQIKSGDTYLLQNRRRFPDPGLALIVGIVKMCDIHQIDYLISGMDPVLNRLLRGYGFGMRAAGPLINYYGKRRPYYGEVASILENLHQNHREIWELATNFGKICSNSTQPIG